MRFHGRFDWRHSGGRPWTYNENNRSAAAARYHVSDVGDVATELSIRKWRYCIATVKDASGVRGAL